MCQKYPNIISKIQLTTFPQNLFCPPKVSSGLLLKGKIWELSRIPPKPSPLLPCNKLGAINSTVHLFLLSTPCIAALVGDHIISLWNFGWLPSLSPDSETWSYIASSPLTLVGSFPQRNLIMFNILCYIEL